MTGASPLGGSIAVLGCGPAGLLAAHALSISGYWQPVVYSVKERSPLGGAQYLHSAIPELTVQSPTGMLNYVKLGTRAGYANKVYGSPDAPCSWDKFPEGELPAWSLRTVYEELWQRYEHLIIDMQINADIAASIRERHLYTISTIPRPLLCQCDHNFESQEIWLTPHVDPDVVPEDNTIVYDGTEESSWYRQSRIFGEAWSESTVLLPHDRPQHFGRKPTRHDCDCQPNIYTAGRFGAWQKGVLVDHVFRHVTASFT